MAEETFKVGDWVCWCALPANRGKVVRIRDMPNDDDIEVEVRMPALVNRRRIYRPSIHQLRRICNHCHREREEHVNGQCLFGPTRWQ